MTEGEELRFVGSPKASIILASTSVSRKRLLEASGVPFEIQAPLVDEGEYKLSLESEGASAAEIAETLAEAKARSVSLRRPDFLVLGGDQVLQCGGLRLDKPVDRSEALSQLQFLRGQRHELISCAVIMRNGQRLWHALDQAVLDMRDASDMFLDAYLDVADSLSGPGAYRVEELGAQLFSNIEGSHYTVLGLPLLPLLDYLRIQRILMT